mgnify:CR=1 FL=1
MRNVFGGLRNLFGPLSLLVSVLVPAYFAGAAIGSRYGLWDWRFALGTLTIKYGPMILMGAAGLGVFALIVALLAQPAGGRIAALIAILIPSAGLYYANQIKIAQAHIPPIHDISTDWKDPPQFSDATMQLRGSDANPIEHPWTVFPKSEKYRELEGKSYEDVQKWAYPDVVPIVVDSAADIAYSKALDAAHKIGLAITIANAGHGQIEGVATSFWYAFKDDVAIRVRAKDGGGAIVDLRSVSRVGVSDLGANAARIRAFRTALTAVK